MNKFLKLKLIQENIKYSPYVRVYETKKTGPYANFSNFSYDNILLCASFLLYNK
jgi:hypothetical protein